MKILLLSRFFPYVGGREVLVMLLAQELSKEHQVILATPDIGRVTKDFQIISSDKESLEKCFQTFKPDIIHSHTFYLTPDVIELAKKHGIPVMLTIHGDIYGFGSDADKELFSNMIPKLDHLVTVCDQGTNQMIEHGADIKKLSRIYPGIATEMFESTTASKSIFRNSFQLPLDKFIFITPARMAKYKGLETLLEAIASLDENIKSKCAFWITTPATRYRDDELEYTKEILEKAISLAIKENVFISFADFSAMPFAYKSADAFILPSLTEQFPVTILEAMDSGLPIIATNVGGVKEIVSEDTGYLIPSQSADSLCQAIESVITNNNSTRVRNAQELVKEKFSIKRMKNEYVDLYQKVKTHE